MARRTVKHVKTTKKSKRSKTQKKHRRVVIKAYRRKLYGGNYEKDVTTEEMQGISIKNPDDIVIAFPGTSMSGKEYKEYMERLDRDGADI